MPVSDERMHPTTTIRTGDPRELLALIPFQLGFVPQESAVVVSLRGARSRVGLVARVDLEGLAAPDGGPQVARSLVVHLMADRATRAVLVLYTAQDLRVPGGTSGTRARAHLQVALDYFLGEVPVWVVGPRGYYSLDCDDLGCCPVDGRPLTDLQSTQVGAHMVLTGAHVAASREGLVRIPSAPAQARRSARRAADRWSARRPAAGDPSSAHAWRRDGLALWRTEVGRALEAHRGTRDGTAVGSGADRGPTVWSAPPPTVLGRLQAAIGDVLVRDAVLLSFVGGADRVADRVVAGDGGDGVGRVLRTIVDPAAGRPPEPDPTAAARALLQQVVAHSTRRMHAPALTLLAVLAWWEGDGAQAGVLVERALGVDPEHRLAVLMEETLAAGMPPGWLRTTGP
ncbi:MAG: hypothetical protein JWP95_43 [Actinotalea sp.]|nr:hypothetical protein [Actinotalea sp.]